MLNGWFWIKIKIGKKTCLHICLIFYHGCMFFLCIGIGFVYSFTLFFLGKAVLLLTINTFVVPKYENLFEFMRRLIEPCLSLANARRRGNEQVREMSLQYSQLGM